MYKTLRYLELIILSSFVARLLCLITCEKYVSEMFELVKKERNLDPGEEEETKRILRTIWSHFNDDEDESLVCFTTATFYNTKHLKDKSSEMMRDPRYGMLDLYDLDDLETMSLSSGINFVTYPEKLNEYKEDVIAATIKFFKHMFAGNVYTFETMMKICFKDHYNWTFNTKYRCIIYFEFENLYSNIKKAFIMN